jgi:hypothetical protein
MWRRGAAAGLVLSVWGAAAVAAAPAAVAAPSGGTEELLTISDPRITESSGLAASARHAGVLYTHNDSGDSPRVYAIGPDGKTRATLTLRGAQARDWEAIAAGRDDAGRPALFVGDIGDNIKGWPSISVYRVTEPARLADVTLTPERFRFRYADGPRDAEALLVHPRTGRLYVVSKESDGGGLYQAPAKLRTDRANVLRRIADMPSTVTDGAFSPDGSRLMVRGYLAGRIFSAPGQGRVRELSSFGVPLQQQGESATYSPDGRSLLVGSEGSGSEVYRITLTDPAPASSAPPPGPGDGARPAAKDGDGDTAGGFRTLLAVVLAAGASGLVILGVRRLRR